MRFVDLFCGIGGFHSALERLGHECVFATDIDSHAAAVYESNWGKPGGFEVHCDIREVIDDIPEMDIICAGFPCQPFSKSGSQDGFGDQTRGTLFHDICSLAEKHRPSVLFLENVPNLVRHDNGNTMRVIESRISEMGYRHWWKILSPHKYGTAQNRTRVYIVCIREDLAMDFDFSFPKERHHDLDVRTVLDDAVEERYDLSPVEVGWIEMWEDFLRNVNTDTKLPGHPIWADCFLGEEELPGELQQLTKARLIEIGRQWSGYRWVKPVSGGMRKDEIIKAINLPLWKQDFIRKNRILYRDNKRFIDGWLERWGVLEVDDSGDLVIPVSRSKYEWQAGPTSRTNWENIMQFRPSGIRVKRGDYFPALVAMAQIPVIGWLRRRITPRECARIQDFDVDGLHGKPFALDVSDTQAYKQLGNAVNVNVVRMIQERIDLYLAGVNPAPVPSLDQFA
jgi:DNA (cytosine-5)-methyltransferase 1